MTRADGFDIPYEMHIGSTKVHLTVAPQVIEIAEKIIRERIRGIYDHFTKIRRASSGFTTFVFGEKCNGCYHGIDLVVSAEYDTARRLTEVSGTRFGKILMSISERYLSDPRLVAEFANGNIGGILGFERKGHSRNEELKNDLILASPQSSYDLLQFLGAIHGTRNWLYNAKTLVKNGICGIGDIPSHTDDVFMLLRDEIGIDPSVALNISGKLSRGRRNESEAAGVDMEILTRKELPAWLPSYIEKVRKSVSKASTVTTLRIALTLMWFKINYPEKFCLNLRDGDMV